MRRYPVSMLVFLISLAAGWFMAGLIWETQRVHYPLFDLADRGRWDEFHRRHVNAITPIVFVVMTSELVTSVWLLFARPSGLAMWVAIVSAVLAIGMWVSTAALQIPAHGSLRRGYTDASYRRLVGTNWIRTIGWTVRAIVMTVGAWQVMSSR